MGEGNFVSGRTEKSFHPEPWCVTVYVLAAVTAEISLGGRSRKIN